VKVKDEEESVKELDGHVLSLGTDTELGLGWRERQALS
jgi:hypothetical protein